MTINDTQPLISIGMPIYNAGDYLQQAINSIKQQTYSNWELIIFDDGSTDKALDNLVAENELDDARIKVCSDGSNKGLAARLNECIDMAHGVYFARMDQDDIALPDRFATQLQYLIEHPNVDLVSCKVRTINMEGDMLSVLPFQEEHDEIVSRPWRSFYMPHPTWMGKMSWFRKFKYTMPGPYLSEDQDLLLRAYQHSRYAAINEVLLYYRVRDSIQLNKTIKTYYVIWQFQFNFFLYERPIYIIYSTSVFISRVFNICYLKIKELKRKTFGG